jgi:ABC-type lipoprotein export system ATPase subunit
VTPLVLDDISHSITDAGREKCILAPLSRNFDSGRFHVINGASGSGKTTLLSLLSLTVKASRGLIFWGNENLSALSTDLAAQWRRARLGMVFQTNRLVSVMSVGEHIRLAAAIRQEPGALDDGERLLDTLGMADKRNYVPSQLSAGEKQRVAIAQAMCTRPAILLADEPTTALDRSNALIVAEALRNYARAADAVVVCVSNDRTVIDAADELLVLHRPES